jgi:hypothetical protein
MLVVGIAATRLSLAFQKKPVIALVGAKQNQRNQNNAELKLTDQKEFYLSIFAGKILEIRIPSC